tara:strand:- start:168 stop:392 length:225 start_codon:yes stop_codon:yes gene_type:complete
LSPVAGALAKKSPAGRLPQGYRQGFVTTDLTAIFSIHHNGNGTLQEDTSPPLLTDEIKTEKGPQGRATDGETDS